jgi:hypothetical protein
MIRITNQLLKSINCRIYYLQMAGIQSNFDLISSYSEPTFTIKKYQSNKTGMKLYHANVPLPLIKLEICVHTKPYDDTGCAHTLGKLILEINERSDYLENRRSFPHRLLTFDYNFHP